MTVVTSNDILGTEGGFMFYGPARDAYMWHPSVAAKLLEALAPDKGRVIFMAADQKPWSWYPHTPAETQLCIASSVANGANVWYGLHGSTELMDTPGGSAAADAMRFLARHEEFYDAARSAARVAVLFSYETERSYRTTGKESDFYGKGVEERAFCGNFSDAFHGFCDLLARSGIPHDVVTDFDLTADTLSRYECLLMPTCACLREETADLVRAFVEDGGNLIATFDTSLYNAHGEPLADFALADVFGAHHAGRTTAYSNFNYFSACSAHPLFEGMGIRLLPAPPFGLDVAPTGSAEVLARFHVPQPGRYTDPTPPDKPAVILNGFGAGWCLYLAGTFAEMAHTYAQVEYRKLIANTVRRMSRSTVVLEGGIGNVEVTTRMQEGRLIVHLVNYAGVPPRPFERLAPQTGLRLRLPCDRPVRSARALAAGAECGIRREDDALIVEVPTLNVYEVVVLE